MNIFKIGKNQPKSRYRFAPKEDITAYELAILIKPLLPVITNLDDHLTKDEIAIIDRHLKNLSSM